MVQQASLPGDMCCNRSACHRTRASTGQPARRHVLQQASLPRNRASTDWPAIVKLSDQQHVIAMVILARL